MLILEKSLKTLYTQFTLVSCIHVHKSSSHKLLTAHGNSHIHTKKLQHQYCGWFNFSLLSASQQNASYKHSKPTYSKIQKTTFFKEAFFSLCLCTGVGLGHIPQHKSEGQRSTSGRNQFSPSPMCVPGIKLRLLGLAAKALYLLIQRCVSLAPNGECRVLV